jgi:hypothetical protein
VFVAPPTADVKCSLVFTSPARVERVVLRSEIPPEAEYAMFEIGEIELGAHEPGRGVRELGYQTNAGDARKRLANVGMSAAVAREVALAFQPVLSDSYARGPAVKRVARYLNAGELFQSDGFDAGVRRYSGVFLDLVQLSFDLELDQAAATLQALYLATLLENEPDDTEIVIHTDLCTKGSKPGTRTYKRPSFADVQRLMNAIGGLAHKGHVPVVAESLPRATVVDWLREKQDTAPDDDARALYKSLEAAVSVREMPEKGPLANAELWAIEQRIEANQFEGTLDTLDDIERRVGRTPGTTYLRARISLELRLEPPKLIAERVSALALSMTSFEELSLLAAEAWLEAGDAKRAVPYARDLVDSPTIEEGLKLKAQTLLTRAETNKPKRRMSPTLADPVRAPMAASRMPAPPPPLDNRPTPIPPPPTPTPTQKASRTTQKQGDEAFGAGLEPPPPPTPSAPKKTAKQEDDSFGAGLGIEDLVLDESSPKPKAPVRSLPPPLPSSRSMRAAPSLPSSSRKMPSAMPAPLPPEPREPSGFNKLQNIPTQDELAIPDIPHTEPELPNDRPSSFPPLRSQKPAAAEPTPMSIPPPLELALEPTDPAASFTLDLPGPDAVPDPAPMSAQPAKRRMGGGVIETKPPSSFDPRAEPDGPVVPRAQSSPEIRSVAPAPNRPRSQPAPARRNSSMKPLEPPPFSNVPSNPPVEDPFANSSFGEDDEKTPPKLEAPPLPAIDSPVGTEPSLPPSAASIHSVETAPPPAGLPKDIEAPISRQYMRGASMPPFRLENPAPMLPKAPLLPRLTGDQLAEHLPLPSGIGGGTKPKLDVLPTSVLEARIQFTMLSRELGLDYRLKRGIELRADITGIEHMQAVLAEMFPDRVVRSKDEAWEVRRHGAFLSEILARRLDAEWMDISSDELGHWHMIVPPDTRIWPFGRVSRLISMGQKERDLCSYFFELSARAKQR